MYPDVTQCLRQSSQLCLVTNNDSSSHVASILPSTEAVDRSLRPIPATALGAAGYRMSFQDRILKFPSPATALGAAGFITYFLQDREPPSSFGFTALFTSRPGPGLQHHLSPGAEEGGDFKSQGDAFQSRLCLLLAECPSPPLGAAMRSSQLLTQAVLYRCYKPGTISSHYIKHTLSSPTSTGSPPELS